MHNPPEMDDFPPLSTRVRVREGLPPPSELAHFCARACREDSYDSWDLAGEPLYDNLIYQDGLIRTLYVGINPIVIAGVASTSKAEEGLRGLIWMVRNVDASKYPMLIMREGFRFLDELVYRKGYTHLYNYIPS